MSLALEQSRLAPVRPWGWPRAKDIFWDSPRERKLNTNFFFLKLFGQFRDIPAKSRDIPPKKLDFPGFEGRIELFGPHPFTWKTPTPPENIRTKKFGFGFLFLGWSPALARKDYLLLPLSVFQNNHKGGTLDGGTPRELLQTQRRCALIRTRDVSKPVLLRIKMPCFYSPL